MVEYLGHVVIMLIYAIISVYRGQLRHIDLTIMARSILTPAHLFFVFVLLARREKVWAFPSLTRIPTFAFRIEILLTHQLYEGHIRLFRWDLLALEK